MLTINNLIHASMEIDNIASIAKEEKEIQTDEIIGCLFNISLADNNNDAGNIPTTSTNPQDFTKDQLISRLRCSQSLCKRYKNLLINEQNERNKDQQAFQELLHQVKVLLQEHRLVYNSIKTSLSDSTKAFVNGKEQLRQKMERYKEMCQNHKHEMIDDVIEQNDVTVLEANDEMEVTQNEINQEQFVEFPQGFENLFENGETEDFNDDSSILGFRPPSALSEYEIEFDSPPKKRRHETGRSETKPAILGPNGKIVERKYKVTEMDKFVKKFKDLRNRYGFKQGDVGASLGNRYGAEFSQTTLSRFEAFKLSHKNMCRLRPFLEEWLDDIEKAVDSGVAISDLLTMSLVSDSFDMNESNTSEFCQQKIPQSRLNVVPPLKKRRKRTNLDSHQQRALDKYFRTNPRPEYNKINEISTNLNLDNDIVRVWFCNRRQKMRKIDID